MAVVAVVAGSIRAHDEKNRIEEKRETREQQCEGGKKEGEDCVC